MSSPYKALLLPAVVICFCSSACAHKEQKRTVGDAHSAGAEELSASRPQAPTALTLRIIPEGFLLNWSPSPQDPGGVTGYEIVRTTAFSGPYETVGTVSKGVFSFVDKTAKPEAIYFYKVRAIAGSQYSPFSREASGEMPGRP